MCTLTNTLVPQPICLQYSKTTKGALDALTISPFLVIDDKSVKFSMGVTNGSVSTEYEVIGYKILRNSP